MLCFIFLFLTVNLFKSIQQSPFQSLNAELIGNSLHKNYWFQDTSTHHNTVFQNMEKTKTRSLPLGNTNHIFSKYWVLVSCGHLINTVFILAFLSSGFSHHQSHLLRSTNKIRLFTRQFLHTFPNNYFKPVAMVSEPRGRYSNKSDPILLYQASMIFKLCFLDKLPMGKKVK